jgi:hypothetical protein
MEVQHDEEGTCFEPGKAPRDSDDAFSVLGTAGCMTWHRPVTSTADDVESMIDPTIDPAADKCEAFSCEP